MLNVKIIKKNYGTKFAYINVKTLKGGAAMSWNRRDLFKLGILGAVVGGIGKLATGTAQAVPIFGGEPTFNDVYKQIGRYIFLVPGKFAGLVAAYDMSTGMCLAWANMSIWAGNRTPIVHHLAAFASPDPYKEFEFVVNTQGGKNLYIYGVATPVKDPDPGFNIWRMKYDGSKMVLLEEVDKTTGLGLGVHVTAAPDNKHFAVADGQKDIFAVFEKGEGTAPSKVKTAVFFDWEPNNKELSRAWLDGGTLIIKKLHPPYDYIGTKGNKLDWELVPGGELFAEQGKVTGARVRNACALDSLTWNPTKPYAAAALRTIGCAVIFDTRTWEPVACLVGSDKFAKHGYKLPIKKVSADEWEVKFPFVPTPAHQAGFHPSGNYFVLMNNIRENSMPVFDCSSSDPGKWTKIASVGDPSWRGAYPNPFHMVFTPDGKKLFVTLWWPAPTPNGLAAVDTDTWKIEKTITIGPDIHTLAITYDGKHLLGVFSGYQKTHSGMYVLRVKDYKLLGYLPSPLGHHDCVIVPRTTKDLYVSRCTTT